jgi:hypothetical protein
VGKQNYPPVADQFVRDILKRLKALETAAQTRVALDTITSGGLTVDGGNISVLAGMVSVGTPGNGGVVLAFNGPNGYLYFPGIVPNVQGDANLELNFLGSGEAERSFLTISSAMDATQLDYIAANWYASSQDGTGYPQIGEAYVDSSGTPHFMRTLDYTGCATTGPSTAVEPGTGTSRGNPAVPETWHSLTADLDATWSAPAGITTQIRKQSDGTVMLAGQVVTTNTALASGAAIATLPAGYEPLQAWYGTGALVGSTGVVQLEVAATGIVTAIFSGTLNKPTISLDQIRFSTI